MKTTYASVFGGTFPGKNGPLCFRNQSLCLMCITRKKTAILQSLEPGADVSDATVEVDARSPFVLVLTIPASLVSVLFLLVSCAALPCLRVR